MPVKVRRLSGLAMSFNGLTVRINSIYEIDSPEVSQFAYGTIGMDFLSATAGFELDLAHPYFTFLQ